MPPACAPLRMAPATNELKMTANRSGHVPRLAMLWLSGAALALAGCGTMTIEDAVPAAALAEAEALQQEPSAARSGVTNDYPNLNVSQLPAGEQFSDPARAALAADLRRRRGADSAGNGPLRDDSDSLRQIGARHGEETLRIIEGR